MNLSRGFQELSITILYRDNGGVYETSMVKYVNLISYIKAHWKTIAAYAFVILAPILYFPILALSIVIGPILNITFQIDAVSLEGLVVSFFICFAAFSAIWATLHYLKRMNKHPYRMALFEIGANIVVTALAALLFGKFDDELFLVVYLPAVVWPSLVYLIAYLFERFVLLKIQKYLLPFTSKVQSGWAKFGLSVGLGIVMTAIFRLHLVCWDRNIFYVDFIGGILCTFVLTFLYVQIRTFAPCRFLAGSVSLIGGLIVSLYGISCVSLPLNEVRAVRFLLAVSLFWLTVGLLGFEVFCSLKELVEKWEKKTESNGYST